MGSHILLSRAIVISQLWYRFSVSQTKTLIFGMYGAEWVKKGNFKGFLSQTCFNHFWPFFLFLGQNPKNGQKWSKNGRAEESFEVPFIKPFCTLHAKSWGLQLRNRETVPQLPDSGVY